MAQVEQQMAAEQAMTMFQKTLEKCFNKCITKPGAKVQVLVMVTVGIDRLIVRIERRSMFSEMPRSFLRSIPGSEYNDCSSASKGISFDILKLVQLFLTLSRNRTQM